MGSTEHTEQRAELIAHIASKLLPLGFIQEADKFRLEFDHQMQGTSMIINGRPMQTPGRTVHYKFELDLLGPGAVISEDGSEQGFENLRFSITDDINGYRDADASVYYDESEEFDKQLKSMFNL